MLLRQRDGFRVEVTNPSVTAGVQHCWITDKRPGSPTLNTVLVHVKADTIGEAVEKATDELQRRLLEAPQE